MEKEFFLLGKEPVATVVHLLGEKSLKADNMDLWVWKENDTYEYTVKFAYKILKDDAQGDVVALYKSFWRIKAQPSSLFTAWRVMEDKIATKANLERSGINLGSNICCLCEEDEETTSRLFCACRSAWLVWSKCYEWVGLASTNHWEPKKHFINFKLSGINEVVNQISDCVWIAVVEEVWKHRNKKFLKMVG